MKKIMRWLESKFFRPQVSIVWGQQSNHGGVKSKDEDYKDDPYVEVRNHLDNEYAFAMHESAIDSIELVDAAETFVSNDLKIIAVRVDHEMYINGHPMIWNEKEQAENDDEWVNHNRKLMRMFESFITDLAVKDSFQQEEG